MDLVSEQALNTLRSDLEDFMTGVALPGQSLTLSLIPKKIQPTGIGAYVGQNEDPFGDIVGRKVEATAEVSMSANDSDIGTLLSSLTNVFATQDVATLREKGIFKLSMAELGPPMPQSDSDVTLRNVSFDVLYEFLKRPDTASGTISSIPLELDLNLVSNESNLLINSDFDTDWEDKFTVVDDPKATIATPSSWAFDEVESRMTQTSAIRGGGLTPTKLTAGTYLVLDSQSGIAPVENFLLETRVETSGQDGIGFVFRFQDEDNFYYFIMSARHSFFRLGKKVGSTFEYFETGGFEEGTAYTQDVELKLQLVANGSDVSVFLDDELIVQGSDSELEGKGRVGLMCHGNNSVFFHRFKLIEFV